MIKLSEFKDDTSKMSDPQKFRNIKADNAGYKPRDIGEEFYADAKSQEVKNILREGYIERIK